MGIFKDILTDKWKWFTPSKIPSGALPGTHLCLEHQGNHSHYAKSNCDICRLKKQLMNKAKPPETDIDHAFSFDTYISKEDGKFVIHIDTHDPIKENENGPQFRVYINDDIENPIWNN